MSTVRLVEVLEVGGRAEGKSGGLGGGRAEGWGGGGGGALAACGLAVAPPECSAARVLMLRVNPLCLLVGVCVCSPVCALLFG